MLALPAVAVLAIRCCRCPTLTLHACDRRCDPLAHGCRCFSPDQHTACVLLLAAMHHDFASACSRGVRHGARPPPWAAAPAAMALARLPVLLHILLAVLSGACTIFAVKCRWCFMLLTAVYGMARACRLWHGGRGCACVCAPPEGCACRWLASSQPASPSTSQFQGHVCRLWLRVSVLFPWQGSEFASVHFAPATVEGQQLSVSGCCCVT